ncbi:MAG: glycoside hydrolase family 1 protein [Deltaproteobacteria bacterium]|nr:glycoside hydrolase family 1 protein [Deltaproteobacteria bacterium]
MAARGAQARIARRVGRGVVAAALAGCGGAVGARGPAVRFPEGFLWGTATAGFQVEMGCPTLERDQCEDRGSDWYAFATSPQTIASPTAHLSGDPPTSGPGQWELYAEDFARASRELSNDAYRMSLEWSRIFPEPTDGAATTDELRALASPAALAGYHAMLGELRAQGLRPMVTLDHYTLPSWIHDAVGCHLDFASCERRGWVDRERIVREIAKYAGFAAAEFGAEVDVWATLNEPLAVFYPGYLYPSEERSNPPAVLLQTEAAKTAIFSMIDAHARMYDAVRAADLVDADGDGEAASIGLVYNLSPVYPKNADRPGDVLAAKNVRYLYDEVFLRAVALGELDDDLDGDAEVRSDLVGRMDWLGVNFYNRIFVEQFLLPGLAILPGLSPLTTFNPLTLEYDRDYARGLYESLTFAWQRFGRPIYVTENGSPPIQGYPEQDRFLIENLAWIQRALADGVDVRGYFYWSLIDNYEWNQGMGTPFGLYAVDPSDPTKRRVARPAAAVYADVAQRNGISGALMSRFPIDPRS